MRWDEKPVELVRCCSLGMSFQPLQRWAWRISLRTAVTRTSQRLSCGHSNVPNGSQFQKIQTAWKEAEKVCKKDFKGTNFINVLHTNHIADPVQLVRKTLLAEFEHLTEIQWSPSKEVDQPCPMRLAEVAIALQHGTIFHRTMWNWKFRASFLRSWKPS